MPLPCGPSARIIPRRHHDDDGIGRRDRDGHDRDARGARGGAGDARRADRPGDCARRGGESRAELHRSEEHTSELQSLMRLTYAVFCLKTKTVKTTRSLLSLLLLMSYSAITT